MFFYCTLGPWNADRAGDRENNGCGRAHKSWWRFNYNVTCLQDSHKAACQFKTSLESMPEKEREIKGGDATWSWGSPLVRLLLINILRHDRRGREREMDGAQERGRLKRQMKGRHIERREMWQWEALVTERGTKGWMNEREAESRREGGWGEQCLNIELNTDRYEKRKEATVCYIWERRERQEPNNSSFLVIGGKEKDRKAAVHPGSSEAFNWRWGEAG